MHISSAIPARGTPGIGGENFKQYRGITLFFYLGYRGKFATLQEPKDSPKDSEVKYKFHSFLTRRIQRLVHGLLAIFSFQYGGTWRGSYKGMFIYWMMHV